jgi:two-component system nitrogen regulation response regulator GlnG
MPVPSSGFNILLLTADTDLQAHFKLLFKSASITIARDAAAANGKPKQAFDAVIVESRHGETLTLPDSVDPAHTLLITGSRAVLKRTAKTMQMISSSNGHAVNGKVREASLESYLEMKMEDFVKGMRNGSARNLHPILISAVERPLITSALRETDGNQIQAAELLGLNRNTLRKKIVDLHIPLKRTRSKAARTS